MTAFFWAPGPGDHRLAAVAMTIALVVVAAVLWRSR